MNDINATIGNHNLPFVIENIKIHRENANYYLEKLKNIKCVKLLEINNDINASWWLFTFLIKNRDDFITFMREKGVCVSQVHGRNDRHTTVSEFKTSLPLLDELEKEIVCIPVGWWVTEKNREYIVECIKEWDNKN